MAKHKTKLLTAIDIGSSKVCCFIAEHTEGGVIEVLGIGHYSAMGIKSGVIIDMEAAEEAIANAVQTAEIEAGERVTKAYVNISGGFPNSETLTVDTSVAGQEISDLELRRLLALGTPKMAGDRDLIHKIPIYYQLDDTQVQDPRGMFGNRLAARIHAVTVGSNVLRTVSTCVRRCHIDVEAFIVSPFASALACLVEDEMTMGATVIDMGGGTTSMAVFVDGHIQYNSVIPVGGNHITMDLAKGLSTSIADAERFKVLHGSAIVSSMEDREILDVPVVGEQDKGHISHIPRSYLSRIIQPRIEETFEMVRSKLEESGFNRSAGRLVVLTGGASQLPGVRDAAALILDKKIRLGKPLSIKGLGDAYHNAAYATCSGLLKYATLPKMWQPGLDKLYAPTRNSRFQKVSLWLRENF